MIRRFIIAMALIGTCHAADGIRSVYGPSPLILRGLETSTLLEWGQNLRQACGRKGCGTSARARETQVRLEREIHRRFEQQTGSSIRAIGLDDWSSELASRSTAERCRLVRSAFVLSLMRDKSPDWRLFTHEKPRKLLVNLGHQERSTSIAASSPICPDYFFPESDVLEQALERGRRLFRGQPLGRRELEARIRQLESRYLTRGTINRSPAG